MSVLRAAGWIIAAVAIGACGFVVVGFVLIVTLIGMHGIIEGPLWHGLGVIPICLIVGGGVLSDCTGGDHPWESRNE